MSVVVASVLFATLQTFLPRSASDRSEFICSILLLHMVILYTQPIFDCSIRGEPASLIISTQIAVDHGKVATNSLSEEGVVKIEFQFPAVPIVRNMY